MNKRTIASLILGATVALAASSAHAAPETVHSWFPKDDLLKALVGNNSAITIVDKRYESANDWYTAAVTKNDGYITLSSGSAFAHNALWAKTRNPKGYSTYLNLNTQGYYGGGVLLDRETTGANAKLAEIAGVGVAESFDTALLTFSFTLNDPTINAITTSFIFATDETGKKDYKGDILWHMVNNDVFAFWVDDVNYALLPNGNVVTVHNAKDYFIDGEDYGYVSRTEEIKITALLDPNRTTHTITIAIADVDSWFFPDNFPPWEGGIVDTGGSWYDSGFYMSGLNFTTVTSTVPEPETWAMLLAGLGLVGVTTKRRRRQK